MKAPSSQVTHRGARGEFQGNWREDWQALIAAAKTSDTMIVKLPQSMLEASTDGLPDALAAFSATCGETTPSVVAAPRNEPSYDRPANAFATGYGLRFELMANAPAWFRIARIDNPLAEELGLRVGDIVTCVRRYDPTVKEACSRTEGMEFLSGATSAQSFQLDILRGATREPVLVRLSAPIPISGLELANATDSGLIEIIMTGDLDLVRETKNWDKDVQEGRRNHLNALYVHYHNAFGRRCGTADHGPFVTFLEREDLRVTNRFLGTDNTIQGKEHRYVIRERYAQLYRRAKNETPGLRGYFRNLDIDYLAKDMYRFVGANGCDSNKLREFETSLANAVDR